VPLLRIGLDVLDATSSSHCIATETTLIQGPGFKVYDDGVMCDGRALSAFCRQAAQAGHVPGGAALLESSQGRAMLELLRCWQFAGRRRKLARLSGSLAQSLYV
jgi:hypothetical protein